MRELIWSRLDPPGMEHFRLSHEGGTFVASGMVVGVEDDAGFRLGYSIRCDDRWRVRRVVAELIGEERGILLLSDGEGLWTKADGEPLVHLDGCTFVDITATPFTNTLPVRRTRFELDEPALIRVAYLSVPALTVEPDEQLYTLLGSDEHGSSFRFEQIATGFTADIRFDHDGLVAGYSGLFERVWSR